MRTIERARDVPGAVVRLIVNVAPEAEGQVRPIDLRRALRDAGAYFIAGIKLELEKPTTRARLQLDPSRQLSPLEMLSLYLETKKVPPARAARLIELAKTLMPEEPAASEAVEEAILSLATSLIPHGSDGDS